MTLEEAYLTMQENCGIEVGDTVKVLRKAKSEEMGWSAIWTGSMSDLVGKTAKVTEFDKDRNGLSLNDDYWFPFFVLELVEKAPKIIKRFFNEKGEDITDKLSEETKAKL